MDTQTTHKVTTIKTPLSRKALILTGAISGLIIAGGLALIRGDLGEELSVEETTVTED